VTPADLGARIERAYMKTTGAPDPRGARAWFARTARVQPRAVSRWLSGERAFDGPAAALLDLLEQRAAH
jgi:hypothetical protein